MLHEDRRKEAGKMFLDISKYIVTAGLVGGLVAENMPVATAFAIFIVAVVVFLVGFYTIPPKKGAK